MIPKPSMRDYGAIVGLVIAGSVILVATLLAGFALQNRVGEGFETVEEQNAHHLLAAIAEGDPAEARDEIPGLSSVDKKLKADRRKKEKAERQKILVQKEIDEGNAKEALDKIKSGDLATEEAQRFAAYALELSGDNEHKCWHLSHLAAILDMESNINPESEVLEYKEILPISREDLRECPYKIAK